jgi:integrase
MDGLHELLLEIRDTQQHLEYLRATAAVLLAREGMPIPLIQQQLGHKRIETTMIYAKFHPACGDVERYFDGADRTLEGGNRGDSANMRIPNDV